MIALSMIASLQHSYELTVLTFEHVNLKKLETVLGTYISGELNQIFVSRWIKLTVSIATYLHDAFKLSAIKPWNIRWNLFNWYARRLDHCCNFDILICNHAEWDFGPGKRGITYAHNILPFQWSQKGHKVRHRIKYCLSSRLLPYSEVRMRENHILANSHWTATGLHQKVGYMPNVLYPPVKSFTTQDQSKIPFTFISAGRAVDNKNWNWQLDIIEQLRKRGHELTLRIFLLSEWDEQHHRLKEIEGKLQWFQVSVDVPRMRYEAALLKSSYFISTSMNESFGIVIAEALKAGCICFSHNSGGPVEILQDPRLLFEDVSTAVDKIDRVLTDPELENQMRDHCRSMGTRFSQEKFRKEFIEQINTYNKNQTIL